MADLLRTAAVRRCTLLFTLALLSLGAPAQSTPSQAESPSVARAKHIEDAVAKVKSGNCLMDDIEVIAAAGPERAAEVLPALKAQFSSAPDPSEDARGLPKDSLAAALILLGDKDEAVWNYLAALAISAAKDDAPFSS